MPAKITGYTVYYFHAWPHFSLHYDYDMAAGNHLPINEGRLIMVKWYK